MELFYSMLINKRVHNVLALDRCITLRHNSLFFVDNNVCA